MASDHPCGRTTRNRPPRPESADRDERPPTDAGDTPSAGPTRRTVLVRGLAVGAGGIVGTGSAAGEPTATSPTTDGAGDRDLDAALALSHQVVPGAPVTVEAVDLGWRPNALREADRAFRTSVATYDGAGRRAFLFTDAASASLEPGARLALGTRVGAPPIESGARLLAVEVRRPE